jgi:hypothetical protein
MKTDPALKSFSHVILDEIHERSTESDFILSLLKLIISKVSSINFIYNLLILYIYIKFLCYMYVHTLLLLYLICYIYLKFSYIYMYQKVIFIFNSFIFLFNIFLMNDYF